MMNIIKNLKGKKLLLAIAILALLPLALVDCKVQAEAKLTSKKPIISKSKVKGGIPSGKLKLSTNVGKVSIGSKVVSVSKAGNKGSPSKITVKSGKKYKNSDNNTCKVSIKSIGDGMAGVVTNSGSKIQTEGKVKKGEKIYIQILEGTVVKSVKVNGKELEEANLEGLILGKIIVDGDIDIVVEFDENSVRMVTYANYPQLKSSVGLTVEEFNNAKTQGGKEAAKQKIFYLLDLVKGTEYEKYFLLLVKYTIGEYIVELCGNTVKLTEEFGDAITDLDNELVKYAEAGVDVANAAVGVAKLTGVGLADQYGYVEPAAESVTKLADFFADNSAQIADNSAQETATLHATLQIKIKGKGVETAYVKLKDGNGQVYKKHYVQGEESIVANIGDEGTLKVDSNNGQEITVYFNGDQKKPDSKGEIKFIVPNKEDIKIVLEDEGTNVVSDNPVNNNNIAGPSGKKSNSSSIYSSTPTGGGSNVQKIDIRGTKIPSIPDQEFTGKHITPDVKVYHNGKIRINGVDYKVVYENNIDVGEATAIVIGTGEFTGKVKTNFNIVAGQVNRVVINEKNLKVGQTITATAKDSSGNTIPNDKLDWAWFFGSEEEGTYQDITGATSSSYTIPDDNGSDLVGKYLKVTATAKTNSGYTGSASGVTTSAVAKTYTLSKGGDNTTMFAVTVDGQPAVGEGKKFVEGTTVVVVPADGYTFTSVSKTISGVTTYVGIADGVCIFSLAGDTEVTAELAAKTAKVIYKANDGADPATDDVESDAIAYSASSYEVASNTFTNGTDSFVGWNTAANGSGTGYAVGQDIIDVVKAAAVAGENVTIYAQWRSTSDTLTGIAWATGSGTTEVSESTGKFTIAGDVVLTYTKADKLTKTITISASDSKFAWVYKDSSATPTKESSNFALDGLKVSWTAGNNEFITAESTVTYEGTYDGATYTGENAKKVSFVATITDSTPNPTITVNKNTNVADSGISTLYAAPLTTVAFTPEAQSGYVIDGVTAVYGESNTKLDVTKSGSTWSFTMPPENVTVTIATVTTEYDEARTAFVGLEIEAVNDYTQANAASQADTEYTLESMLTSKYSGWTPEVTISQFDKPVDGTEQSPSGTNGSVVYTYTLTKDGFTSPTCPVIGSFTTALEAVKYVDLSDDASITSVLSEAIDTSGSSEDGSEAAKALEASINVANSVAAVKATDIVVHDAATATLYSDAEFNTEADADEGIALTAGTPVTVYIKVVAEDGTTLYYAVEITRADNI